jgi:hypothetical protein
VSSWTKVLTPQVVLEIASAIVAVLVAASTKQQQRERS